MGIVGVNVKVLLVKFRKVPFEVEQETEINLAAFEALTVTVCLDLLTTFTLWITGLGRGAFGEIFRIREPPVAFFALTKTPWLVATIVVVPTATPFSVSTALKFLATKAAVEERFFVIPLVTSKASSEKGADFGWAISNVVEESEPQPPVIKLPAVLITVFSNGDEFCAKVT